MPFLSPNQQHQSTEGKRTIYALAKISETLENVVPGSLDASFAPSVCATDLFVCACVMCFALCSLCLMNAYTPVINLTTTNFDLAFHSLKVLIESFSAVFLFLLPISTSQLSKCNSDIAIYIVLKCRNLPLLSLSCLVACGGDFSFFVKFQWRCPQLGCQLQLQHVCVEPFLSAVSMTLPAFAAERRCLQHARIYRGHSAANLQATIVCYRLIDGTYRWTDV